MPQTSSPKIGLALGGGGVRGFAHIGVLKAFEDEGIPVHVIAGSSAGAIVGGNYCVFTDARVVEKRLMSFISSEAMRKIKVGFIQQSREGEKDGFFYNVRQTLRKGIVYTTSVRKLSMVDEEIFDFLISGMVPNVNIEETRLPFMAVAFDILKGKEIIFTSGSMRLAVKASSAIPGIFPPVKWNGLLLVDGGWLHLVPIKPLLNSHPDIVVGVDVSKEAEEPEELMRGINILLRSYEMVRMNVKDLLLRDANVVLRPRVGDIHWADYGRAKECISRGYEAAVEKVDEVRKCMEQKKRRRTFFSLFRS